MTGIEAITAERQRQIEVEGWTPEHDDASGGAMALAAASYAMHSVRSPKGRAEWWETSTWLKVWPWSRDWWKPTNPRRDLVKAGALIAAEIDRLDRLDKTLTQ